MDVTRTRTWLASLQALLPPGSAISREPGANVTQLLEGAAASMGEAERLFDAWFAQYDPVVAVEMLADWERLLGLPDCCDAGIVQTVDERRVAVLEKLTVLGGSSRQYFIDMMARRGVVITIDELGNHRWRVNRDLLNVVDFTAGHSVAGDPVRRWGDATMECRIERLKPAHTEVVFGYPDWVELDLVQGVLPGAVTFTRPDETTCATRVNALGWIETAPADEPLFDFDPITHACKGLVLEASATNMWRRSDQINDSSWAKTGVTVPVNATLSPANSMLADKLQESGGGGLHRISNTEDFTAGLIYTASIFVKSAGQARYLNLLFASGAFGATKGAIFDPDTGAISTTDPSVTVGADQYADGWWRVIATATATDTASSAPEVRLATAEVISPSYSGDGASGLYLWGGDLREGYPGRYIATVSNTVTRAAASAVIANLADLQFGVDGWTGVVEWQNGRLGFADWQGVPLCLSDGTTDNCVLLYVTSVGAVYMKVISGGTATVDVQVGATVAGQICKAAVTVMPTTVLASVNGEATITAPGAVPMTAIDRATLSCDAVYTATSYLDGWLRRVRGHRVPQLAAALPALSV